MLDSINKIREKVVVLCKLNKNMAKIITIIAVGLLVIGVVWFIFSPQPEKEDDVIFVEDILGSRSYENAAFGFDTNLPPGFVVNESYLNQNLGPGREIPGVSFEVPESFTKGTNLSSDSHVAVESLTDVSCEPQTFLDGASEPQDLVLGNNAYRRSTSVGAAAGNQYEEIVSVTERGDRCYAVRYFIHTTSVGNYESGTVREYDRAQLLRWFDSIATSLVLR
jgi:hypothetical protein